MAVWCPGEGGLVSRTRLSLAADLWSLGVLLLILYNMCVGEGGLVCRTRLSLAADLWSLGVLLLHLLPLQGPVPSAPTLPTPLILPKERRS